MKGLLKWPLIIAAIVVVARVVAERASAPGWFSNALSVAVFCLLIAPIYFAIRLSAPGVKRPYLTLLGAVAINVAVVRLLVIPTYWLAYVYQWPDNRFSVTQGAGVVGEGVTPLMGYFVIPFRTAAAWIVGTVVFGSAFGAVIIAARRYASR